MYNAEDEKNLPMFARIADIRKRNIRNADNFDEKTHDNAAVIEALARAAYPRSRVFHNYRKGSIMIKVESVTRGDKLQQVNEIAELQIFIDLYNCEVVDLAGHKLIHLRDGD